MSELEEAILKALLVREYIALMPPMGLDNVTEIERQAVIHYHNDTVFGMRVNSMVASLMGIIREHGVDNADLVERLEYVSAGFQAACKYIDVSVGDPDANEKTLAAHTQFVNLRGPAEVAAGSFG